MTIIDIFFGIVAIYGFYRGFSRGIIRTVFTIISILLDIIMAMKFGPQTARLLESLLNSNYSLLFIAGTILTFVLTMIGIRIIATGLENILHSANINIINQVIGGFVMAGMMIALYSVLILFADRSRLITEETRQNTLTYDLLVQYPGRIISVGRMLQPTVEEFWDHSIDFIDRMNQGESVERRETDRVYDIYDDDHSAQRRPVRGE